jgi:hypothetical protein
VIPTVVIICLVHDIRKGAEHGKAVGKTMWHQYLYAILAVQFHGHMFSISGRTPADIDDHIQDPASDDLYDLGLGKGRSLVMKSADDTPDGTGQIVLYPVLGDPMILVSAFTETLKKCAPFIPEDVGFDQQDAGYLSLDDSHISEKN